MIRFPKICFEGEGGGSGGGDSGAPAAAAPATPASAAPAPGAPGTPATPSAAAETSWSSTLAPEAQQLVKTKGWKDVGAAIASYAELEKLVGVDKVALPGKDAKPEEFAAIYDKLGRPESPDKYDLGDFKVPQQWDQDAVKAMLAGMHADGLNSRQVQGQMKRYGEFISGVERALAENGEKVAAASEKALKTEWGADFRANMDLANIAAQQFLGDDLDTVRNLKLADGSLLGDNAAYVRAFARVGQAIAEPSSLAGLGSMTGFAGTPASAKAELEKLNSDEKFQAALRDAAHPEHDAAVRRRTRLYAAAFPEGGK